MPNDDLRADLNAAFDAAESTPATESATTPAVSVESAPSTDTVAVPSEPIGGETTAERDARVRDEKGRFAKAVGTPEKAPEAKVKEITSTPPVDVPPAPVEVAPTPVETVKAPQSWKPLLREKFAALPPEVQQEVVRREREIATTMQESAQYRQEATRFRETMAPFEHMIRAEGADPYRTVGSLMQTAMALQSGAPGTKAGIVANLIKHYGVDINQLASVLEGQPVQQEQAPYRDPRVDQLLAQVEQAKSQRQQAQAAEAQRLIGEIQGEEFFADVKDAMADILEIAAKRGVAMTPKEAYNRAVWADPHVAEVLQQRQAAQRAGTPGGATQRAAAAAASIKASPAVAVNGATQPGNMRGDIEAALERLAGR
jgi:hypothetical protein